MAWPSMGSRATRDSVFPSIGLTGVKALRAKGSDKAGVIPAVDLIAGLRQAADLSTLAVGRNMVVVGGGMTAADATVRSKLLGVESVTMANRRDRAVMAASGVEQDPAAAKGGG